MKITKKLKKKLNKLSIQELNDFYWLYLYPRYLTLDIQNGEVKDIVSDEFIRIEGRI